MCGPVGALTEWCPSKLCKSGRLTVGSKGSADGVGESTLVSGMGNSVYRVCAEELGKAASTDQVERGVWLARVKLGGGCGAAATRSGGLAEAPQDDPRCVDRALLSGQSIGIHT